MLRADNRDRAVEACAESDDPRVNYFWDPGLLTGNAWGKSLTLSRTAWDVYFLFGREVAWGDRAPTPQYWMHQLGLPQTMAPSLNSDSLTKELGVLLKEM